MPRKGFVRRREPAADPKYDNVLVTRFINGMMERRQEVHRRASLLRRA